MKGLWRVILQAQLEELKRVLIWCGHPALGAFTLIIGLYINWIAAALWVWLYLKYETNEDKWIHDRAYVDVKDFMIGFGVMAAIICIEMLIVYLLKSRVKPTVYVASWVLGYDWPLLLRVATSRAGAIDKIGEV